MKKNMPTKTEIKTQTKEHEIVQCDSCGDHICLKCQQTYKFMKWALCSNCYLPFIRKNQERKEKLKIRRERIRKYPGAFEIEFFKAEPIKQIFKAIAARYEEITIEIHSSELVVKSMDPSRITTMMLAMKANSFKKFTNNNRNLFVELEADDLNKILELLDDDEGFTLKRNMGQDHIKIITNCGTFKLELAELELEELNLKNLFEIQHDLKFVIDPMKFLSICERCLLYSKIAEITSTENEVDIKSRMGEFSSKLNREDLIENDIKGNTHSFYNLSHLINPFLRFLMPMIEKLEISLKTDNPLRIMFVFTNGWVLDYFQAPRVEE